MLDSEAAALGVCAYRYVTGEEVTALQYTGDNGDAVIEWSGALDYLGSGTRLILALLAQQSVILDKGDWLVDHDGRRLAVAPVKFDSDYVEIKPGPTHPEPPNAREGVWVTPEYAASQLDQAMFGQEAAPAPKLIDVLDSAVARLRAHRQHDGLPTTASPIPSNWRAQLAAVLTTAEYHRVVNVLRTWPGVADMFETRELGPVERSRLYVAVSSGPPPDVTAANERRARAQDEQAGPTLPA